MEIIYPMKSGKAGPFHVGLIGLGGIGSWFIEIFASYLRALKGANVASLSLLDGDKVCRKNLINQAFREDEISEYKSIALAERHAAAAGRDLLAIPEYLRNEDQLRSIAPNVIVSCVDNNDTRRIIGRHYSRTESLFWLDAGIDEVTGQVITGYSHPARFRPDDSRPGEFRLPSILDVARDFNDPMKDTHFHPDNRSCADTAADFPTNMLTNVTAAMLLINYLNIVLTGGKLVSFGTRFSIVNNSFSSFANTAENLTKYSA